MKLNLYLTKFAILALGMCSSCETRPATLATDDIIQSSKEESALAQTEEEQDVAPLGEAYERIDVGLLSLEPIVYNELLEGEEVGELVTIAFPLAKAADPTLEHFINSTIQASVKAIFGDVTLNPTSEQQKMIEIDYGSDKPFEHYSNYSVSFVNKRYLAIILSEHAEACCGASGTSHNVIPINFDLQQRKLLTLADILKPTQKAALQQVILALAKMDDQLATPWSDFESAVEELYTTPFSIGSEGVTFYFTNDGGHWSSFIGFEIEFTAHSDLFDKDFITAFTDN